MKFDFYYYTKTTFASSLVRDALTSIDVTFSFSFLFSKMLQNKLFTMFEVLPIRVKYLMSSRTSR